jgi:multiple sugar transport system substrate-binding protein
MARGFRWWLQSAAVALAVGLVLPACAAGPTGNGAGGATRAANAQTTTGGELPAECNNVAIQFWNPFSGPDGPYMSALVDQFNAANPQIDVLMVSINNNVPSGAYYIKLSTARAAERMPDVAVVHSDQIATLAFRHLIRPLDDQLGPLGLDADDFPPAVWQTGDVAGQHYAIPLDVHPMTMFYNEELLAAAGADAPLSDQASFASAAETLVQAGQYGFMITNDFPSQQIFQQLLHQFGGSEFDAAGTRATWNSAAGVQALEWMRDAQQRYGQPNLEVGAELSAFKAGRVGAIWNGIWNVTDLTGESVSFASRAVPVPQIGPQPGVWSGSHQLALPQQANPDPCRQAAALLLVRFLIDNSVEWAKAGPLPASNAVRASDAFQALEPQASIAPAVEGVFFTPAVPGINDALAPLGEAVGAVLAGSATDIQATLDDAAARADQILAQNRENFGSAPGATP